MSNSKHHNTHDGCKSECFVLGQVYTLHYCSLSCTTVTNGQSLIITQLNTSILSIQIKTNGHSINNDCEVVFKMTKPIQ